MQEFTKGRLMMFEYNGKDRLGTVVEVRKCGTIVVDHKNLSADSIPSRCPEYRQYRIKDIVCPVEIDPFSRYGQSVIDRFI